MTEQDDRPKWLLELENRKQKQRLGHETGAGAPCLTCESACPGLDLHFWRKICKNCKCRGDDHDFDDDEFPQFELLFGPKIKKKKDSYSVLLKVSDKKQTQSESWFEWVPPDTTKELAADYMKALPSNKLPITGSVGAALRRQQLQKQLPLHDIDHKACDALSEEEKQEFDKYLKNLKKCAGQGKVSKLMTIRPFGPALMTPANATDVKRFSPQDGPQYGQHLPRNLNGGLSLRTPSSFIPLFEKGLPSRSFRQADTMLSSAGVSAQPRSPSLLASEEYALGRAQFVQKPAPTGPSTASVGRDVNSVATNVDVVRAQQLQVASEANPRLGRYHHALASVSGDVSLAEAASVPGSYHAVAHPLTSSHPDQDRSDNKNPGAPGNGHEQFDQDSTARAESLDSQNGSQVGPQRLQSASSTICHAEPLVTLSKAHVPDVPSRATDVVASCPGEEGLGQIEDKLKSSSKRHDQSSSAASMTSRDLERSSQHSAISASENIKRSAEIAKEFESKPANRMDVNTIKQLLPAAAGRQQPACATETEHCPLELSASLPVQSSLVRSESLDNPVFPQEAVAAPASCQDHNISRLQDELQAMKMSTSSRRECARCEDDIFPGQVVVTADKIKGAVWHPGCFKCCACNELLVDLVYFTYKGKLYCGRDLAKLLEIPRCHACDELIFVREYTVAEGNNYHVKHFCCWDCDTPLANQLYVTENDRPLCLSCYQRYYAKTCNACDNVIAADQKGVAIKDLNFHANTDCFSCITCKRSLLGGQIAVKENKLLCSKECIAEFLHRRKLGR